MGCRQVVRHWFLIPIFEGSNLSIPVLYLILWGYSLMVKALACRAKDYEFKSHYSRDFIILNDVISFAVY
jgi:hypothetical protein